MSTKTAAPRTCSLTNCKPHHAIAGASPATAAAWCATAVTQGDCGHPARRRIPSEPSLNFPSNRSADSLRSGHPTGLRRNPTGNHNQHHGEQHGQPGPPPIAARPFFHELGDRNEQRGGVFWHVRSQVWWLQQVDGFNRCVQLAVPLATAARRSAPNTISCCEQQIANRSIFGTSARRLVTPRHPLAPTATGRPEWMQTPEEPGRNRHPRGPMHSGPPSLRDADAKQRRQCQAAVEQQESDSDCGETETSALSRQRLPGGEETMTQPFPLLPSLRCGTPAMRFPCLVCDGQGHVRNERDHVRHRRGNRRRASLDASLSVLSIAAAPDPRGHRKNRRETKRSRAGDGRPRRRLAWKAISSANPAFAKRRTADTVRPPSATLVGR